MVWFKNSYYFVVHQLIDQAYLNFPQVFKTCKSEPSLETLPLFNNVD